MLLLWLFLTGTEAEGCSFPLKWQFFSPSLYFTLWNVIKSKSCCLCIHLIHIVAFHIGNTLDFFLSLFFFFFPPFFNAFHPKIPSWFGLIPRYSLATLSIRPVKGSNGEFHAVLGWLSIQMHLQLEHPWPVSPCFSWLWLPYARLLSQPQILLPFFTPQKQFCCLPVFISERWWIFPRGELGRTYGGLGLGPLIWCYLLLEHKRALGWSTHFQFCISWISMCTILFFFPCLLRFTVTQFSRLLNRRRFRFLFQQPEYFSNFYSEYCFFFGESLGLWNLFSYGKPCLSGNLFWLALLFKVLLRGFILCLLGDILSEFCLSTSMAKWSPILSNQSLPHPLLIGL